MKNILLLSTGGTIASALSSEGLTPKLAGQNVLQAIGPIEGCKVQVEDLLSIDSSNMQPEEWVRIAKRIDIAFTIEKVDGIVVTHGTDTMAYTSSALAFMLSNISIPIIVTGSQLPLTHPLSDGLDNIKLAIHAAMQPQLKGVFIAFNRKIMIATRSVKVRTMDFDAFESVNHQEVGIVNARGLQIQEHLLHKCDKPYFFYEQLCSDVFLLKLIPGMQTKVIDMLLQQNFKAVVIEAFGAGGITFIRRDLTSSLERLVKANIPVVVCSQCLYEHSDFSIYQSGQKVLQQGVIQALDMTSEACVTKLMWALAQSNNIEDVRFMFQTNYAQEISL